MMHIDNEYDPDEIKKPDKKKACPWSMTNWAWGRWDEKNGYYACTCRECKLPKRLREETK